MTYSEMPGALLPCGHLINARRAVQRYVESGSQLDLGTQLDELDELRQLVDDVGRALASLATDAKNTRTNAGARAARTMAAAGESLRATAQHDLQPAVLRLMSAVPDRAA